jgi:hypothetical protein
MKIKAAFESILAAVISAIFSFELLDTPATLAAIAIRRKMPDAWFSGLITWYAEFVVLGVSLAIAVVAFRKVYKHAVGSDQKV